MSYGRIVRGFFDSSINDTDPITRLVFIGMIVLSDRQGRLDLTVESLSRRLNLDLDATRHALTVLSSPDLSSRTPEHDGRRIVPLEPGRSWGWLVVNKEQYRKSDGDDDAIRADARDRKRRQRERESNSSFTEEGSTSKEKKHTPCVTVTQASREVTRKCDAIFSRCWSLVPRKEGRKEARKHFDAEVRRLLPVTGTAAEVDAALDRLEADLSGAIANYARSTKNTEPRFVKQGCTLFFNFRDYVDWSPATTAGKAARPEGLQGVAL